MTDLSVDSPESLAWQSERDSSAAAHLESLALNEHFRQLVGKQVVDIRRTPTVRRGDQWFQRVVLRPEDDHPVLVVRTSPTGEGRVLVDPNELSAERGTTVSLMSFHPSPDGSRLAYTLEEAGTERMTIHLLDVATGTALPDELPWVANGNIAWLPDSSGFWCAVRDFSDGGFRMPVYRYLLGGPIPEETPVAPGLSPFVYTQVSPDGRYVAILTGNTEMRVDQVLVDGVSRPLLAGVAGTAHVRFVGDEAVALVQDGSPRGRLVRFPVATATDQATWTELVAETADVLQWIEVVGDRVVLGYLRDAAAGVRVVDLDGLVVDELDLPGRGTVSTVAVGAAHPGLPMLAAGDGEVSFVYSTFDASPAVYRYVVADRRLELVDPPAVTKSGWTVRTITATSTGGASVPAHVVHRADLDLSQPQPTILSGYGGYNLAQLPAYQPDASAWVEAGGVYVLAHLRGGSEYGPEWWHAGRRETKQQTFDDLFAVAERLHELGITTAGQLVAQGNSNGGLLAGAAIVQRPDLWAGVVADVPILDLIGYARDPLTFAIGQVEYGDPSVPEEAEWLRRISPVHNVQPASYPAVLVTAGANDPRCPAWHSRVFVDLLEKAQQGDAPILLRVYAGQGHGAAGLSAVAGKSGDWLAFAAEVTGLKA